MPMPCEGDFQLLQPDIQTDQLFLQEVCANLSIVVQNSLSQRQFQAFVDEKLVSNAA